MDSGTDAAEGVSLADREGLVAYARRMASGIFRVKRTRAESGRDIVHPGGLEQAAHVLVTEPARRAGVGEAEPRGGAHVSHAVHAVGHSRQHVMRGSAYAEGVVRELHGFFLHFVR